MSDANRYHGRAYQRCACSSAFPWSELKWYHGKIITFRLYKKDEKFFYCKEEGEDFMKHYKYKPVEEFKFPQRKWVNNSITKAPIWCSVDLRDGNQALEIPMNLTEKLEFFKFLVDVGFKTIEIGFPAASDTEFEFTRKLIDDKLIPQDVTIQVLTQARADIIKKTFQSLDGVHRAVVHFYNSTSTLQREVVFKMSKDEVKRIATDAAILVKQYAKEFGEERFLFEYSPESFVGTELDYAIEVCNAVIDIIEPTEDRKLIINLPSTVETTTPNVYADQIEYVIERLNNRECLEVSIHAHNDRGTAVASTELALLAGADRVEGTLFGNGERTGNADIMNLALNLYTQGIDPELDFSQIDAVVDTYETLVKMPVHQRHPYAGTLVYTAFSGSHQDAISKGMAFLPQKNGIWEVPYLPIDPKDVGRTYEPIIRINSQSGKGGVSYILETNFGLHIPKKMQKHFGRIVTNVSDQNNKELMPQELYDLFKQSYVNLGEPLTLVNYDERTNGVSEVNSNIIYNGAAMAISGVGEGLIDAFANSLAKLLSIEFEVVDYQEHSLDYGAKSRAITYVTITDSKGNYYFGAGLSSNISKSSLKAILSAVNKMME